MYIINISVKRFWFLRSTFLQIQKSICTCETPHIIRKDILPLNLNYSIAEIVVGEKNKSALCSHILYSHPSYYVVFYSVSHFTVQVKIANLSP